MIATPPPRAAHHFAEEQGDTQEDAQLSLLNTLEAFAEGGLNFHGDCSGRILYATSDEASARFAITSNLGDASLLLTLADNGWLRAELFVGDALRLRAWVEAAYEEKEFWPDGSDGEGEAPGRISKRGAWLTIDSARFPGVPANAHGFWQVEEIT